MDWRRPIDQQDPVAQRPRALTQRCAFDLADSAEYRQAGGDPRLLEFAVQALALRERLRREGHKL